ncbi:4-hydroxy-3-methylbut-2-enyl diphosphate reductase [Streptomyces lushanensis]|uniref:4-hydroxy-3-methylbut-2-enyl diphosphate reductase n=1 Tax=Streptomyces lushanensis TaxID=1434255 RepID=UPI00083163EC|nr:4-hydroxy-3-methylbut-2-enyl diphosphate reductase [Streptomyces lushanensis]
MSRSSVSWYAAAPAPALPVGHVLVADELVWPDGRVMACSAAPMVAGALGAAGHQVVTGAVRLLEEGSGSGLQAAVARAAVSTDRAEEAVGAEGSGGVAVAVAASEAGLRPVVEAAVDSWARITGPRTVLLASPRSFCAGVERAIEVVEALLEQEQQRGPGGRRVFVRKQIVHNTHVIAGLARRGAVFVEELDEVPAGSLVVFSAHGVSPQVRAEAARRNLKVVDATCPLVTKVHAEARRFAERGSSIVLIGHAGHEEVEGTYGEAPDATVVVGSAQDVAGLDLPDPSKVTYLTQTTLAVDETRATIAALKERFPQARGPGSEDICYATTNRQHALEAVTAHADLVLVLGSENSSNSVRLVELARKAGTPAHLIEDCSRVRPAWLRDVATVGLSAGASAPPALVQETLSALAGLGPLTVRERITATEDTHFAPPAAVRKNR